VPFSCIGLEPHPAYGLRVAKQAVNVLLAAFTVLVSLAACEHDRLDSGQEMVASGECAEEIERRFGGTSPAGGYDIKQRDGTTVLRFYASDESDAPAYSCAFVRDETRPNGFKLVDVLEGG
jgi:hypothetical protein